MKKQKQYFYGKTNVEIPISYTSEHEGAENIDFENYFYEQGTKQDFDQYFETLEET